MNCICEKLMISDKFGKEGRIFLEGLCNSFSL